MLSKYIECTKFIFITFTIIFSVPVLSQESTNRERLENFFAEVYRQHLIIGQNIYVHTPDPYDSLGMHAAIQSHDLQWVKIDNAFVSKYKKQGYILSLHWHWFLRGESAWKKKRKQSVTVESIFLNGTQNSISFEQELKSAADKLELLRDNGIVVLWRPFHEMDGNWFWWSDQDNPHYSKLLWIKMHRYFTKDRGLDNLIWVYSMSTGAKKDLSLRAAFYPGDSYVDIVSVDAYDLTEGNTVNKLSKYKSMLNKIAPNKYHALSELDKIPNELINKEKIEEGWLYAAPWWGSPHPENNIAHNALIYNSPKTLHLADIPNLWSFETQPPIGITSFPMGRSIWYSSKDIKLDLSYREFDISDYKVFLLVDDKEHADFSIVGNILHFKPQKKGYIKIQVGLRNYSGVKVYSNIIYVAYGKVNLAESARLKASSNTKDVKYISDGNFLSSWRSTKHDLQDIIIELENEHEIKQVNLHWGWKIHPKKFRVLARVEGKWEEVFEEDSASYQAWGKSNIVKFPAVVTSTLKIELIERAGNQKWGGYDLTEVEIPY